MKEQTAVEWLVTKIINVWQNDHEKWVEIPTKVLLEYAEQAKAMEKGQIINAVDIGFEEGSKFPEDIRLNNSEEYYNETFNNISEKGLKDDV
jgi:hypothetical protein